MSAKLTKYQATILRNAIDSGVSAYHCNGDFYGQAGRRKSEAIRRLMRLNYLWDLPGPRWATPTEIGIAALSADTGSREG